MPVGADQLASEYAGLMGFTPGNAADRPFQIFRAAFACSLSDFLHLNHGSCLPERTESNDQRSHYPANHCACSVAENSNGPKARTVRAPELEALLADGWQAVKGQERHACRKTSEAAQQEFGDRVWSLFYRMGFSHLSADGGAAIAVQRRAIRLYSTKLITAM